MWCLSRMLPILIGDLVPVGDEHWENFLRLLQIEEIIFAPKTSIQLAAYLAVLTEEYLTGFSELYDRRMIPKQHYMVHYPRQIVRRGPLVRNWAMRFEAKHNYFKKLVERINNFKNISYSLARRHQALQAYLLQSSTGSFLRMTVDVGPGRKTTVLESGYLEHLQEIYPEIAEESTLTKTTWAKVYGTKYSRGYAIIVDIRHGIPSFGEIKEVLILDGSEVLLQYTALSVLEYVTHLNAYKVTPGNKVSYIKQAELVDFHPLGKCRGFGCYASNFFVVLKYRIDYLQ
ncbi:hypothetical protein ABFA07_022132 [Porites harrisoni]